LKCLDTLKVESDPGIIHRDIWRGYVLLCAGRISEAEDTTLNVLHSALELTKQGRLESVPYLCMAYFFQARLYQGTGRYYEAEEAFRNSKKILDEFNPQNPRELFIKVDNSTGLYYWLGLLLSVMYRLNEAEKLIRKALDAFDTNYWKPYYSPIEVQGWKRLHQSGLAQVLNYSGKIIEAEKILRTILETCEESVNKPIALHRLYVVLRFQHRHNDQIEVLEQLLVKRKQLAEDNPDYQFSVVEALGLIALPLAQSGQYQRAEKIYREIIEKYRIKVKEEERHLIYFVNVLWDFGTLLALSDRLPEAEISTLEAIDLLRGPAQVYPEKYIQKLAAGMNNLGIIFMHMEKIDHAKETFLEAYNLARDNSLKHEEAVYLAEIYAIITNNLGVHFGIISQWENAERYLKEVYSILETRVRTSPEMFLPHLATVKNNFGILLCEIDRMSEAESKFREALEIRRNYVEQSENFFLPRVASVLNNLGIYYRRVGQPKESEEMYREAIDIMEPFAEKEPRVHQSALVQILSNLRILHSESKDSSAIEATQIRLKELGVIEDLSDEKWFVDMEYL
jgi:tetratricopeptide (TPR) repeat protein